MEPIVLTQFGETLVVRPKDTMKPFKIIGIHDICTGQISWQPISGNCNVVHCRFCGLRIVLLKEVDTYEKLREACGQQITHQKKQRSQISNAIRETMRYS